MMINKENRKNFKKGFFSRLGSFGANVMIYAPLITGSVLLANYLGNHSGKNRQYKKLLEKRPDIKLTWKEIELVENCVHFPEDSKRDLDFMIIDDDSRNLLKKINLGKHNNFLLYGVPGTGKTVLCQAICKTNDIIYVDMDGVKEPYFGKTEQNIMARYRLAKKIGKCAIFLDEIDELCPDRSKIKIIGADSTNTLLKIAVKKVSQEDKILWIGATNYIDQVDSAIVSRLTPIEVKQLDSDDMKKLIQNYFKDDLKITDKKFSDYFFSKIKKKQAGGKTITAREIENYITKLENELETSIITTTIIDKIFLSRFFGNSNKSKKSRRKSYKPHKKRSSNRSKKSRRKSHKKRLI